MYPWSVGSRRSVGGIRDAGEDLMRHSDNDAGLHTHYPTLSQKRGLTWTGIGKILFERIAFPIHIPSAEVDCIPTRNPLFSLGL